MLFRSRDLYSCIIVRWDPNREDDMFFNLAAWLYCAYYYVQIIVHKPFMTAVGKSSPLSFPSSVICTNAARSSSNVADIHSRRSRTPSQFQVGHIFLDGQCVSIFFSQANSFHGSDGPPFEYLGREAEWFVHRSGEGDVRCS